MADQRRVQFDAEVTFRNGGALQTQEFRLDIPGGSIGDGELGELLVRHLGLLMVGEVAISNKVYLDEPHKGSRGTAPAGAARRVVGLDGSGALVRLSGPPELARLVDLPTVLLRLSAGDARPVDRVALAPFDLAGRALLLDAGGAPGGGARLSADAAVLLAERGAALVGGDGPRPEPAAVSVLREAGIALLTGVRALDGLPPEGARLHVVPHPDPLPAPGTAVAPCDEYPVRVYAVVGGG